MRTSAFLSFVLPAAVSASPTLNLKALDAIFCKANDVALRAIDKDAAATPFCSSYLAIPTSTITTVVTQTPSSIYSTIPVTVTNEPITTTETRTESTSVDVTSTTTVVQTELSTKTSTTTSTISCLNSAYTYTSPVATVPTPAGESPQKRDQIKKPKDFPANWAALSISKACSCLSIPTPSTTTTLTTTLVPGTITVYITDVLTPTVTAFETATETATNTVMATETTTTTKVITAYAAATTIASNGVQYRKYESGYNANIANSGFTSSFFKGKTPDFTGALTSLSFSTLNWPNTNQLKLADRPSYFAADQSALLMQGFFIAKETGNYRFGASSDTVDNWAYLWTADTAYSAWDDSNTAFKATRTGDPWVSGTYIIALKAGDAIPITYLWANGGSAGQSLLRITPPSGKTVTDHTGYFVQACTSSVFA